MGTPSSIDVDTDVTGRVTTGQAGLQGALDDVAGEPEHRFGAETPA